MHFEERCSIYSDYVNSRVCGVSTVKDYFNLIRTQLNSYTICAQPEIYRKNKFDFINKEIKTVYSNPSQCDESKPSLVFSDGTQLVFAMRFSEEGEDMHITDYMYTYLDADGREIFGYHKDPKNFTRDHYLCHLHIDGGRKRFPTHSIDIFEVIDFIETNYVNVDV